MTIDFGALNMDQIPTWRRIFLKAAGFGAGCVLAAAICLGVFVWYKNRPAITAKYYRVSTASDGGSKLEFEYVLQNNSSSGVIMRRGV